MGLNCPQKVLAADTAPGIILIDGGERQT